MKMQLTLRNGNLRKVITWETPPYPGVGDFITIKGQGAEWTITRVKVLPDKPKGATKKR